MSYLTAIMIVCLLVYVFSVQPATQEWVCVGGIEAADQFPPIAMAINEARPTFLVRVSHHKLQR